MVSQFFDELAATRIVTRLVTSLEAADEAAGDAANIATQDQALIDERARVAASAAVAADDRSSPMRVADLLERINLTRPAATDPDIMEAGGVFLLPNSVPTTLDAETDRPDTPVPRPALVSDIAPETAAPTSVETQADFRAAEQDAALRRSQLFLDASLVDRRSIAPAPTDTETSPPERESIPALAAIQATSAEADTNGGSNSPLVNGMSDLAATRTNDEASLPVAGDPSGQVLDLSV